MPIVGGLDIHRKQITFDYLDTVTGQVCRGQVSPADREHLRAWLARFAGLEDAAFAVEGCTGWRYVTEELAAAGVAAHLAEPADTAFARGRKRHAKTGKTDCRHLRMLLAEGRLPECWIPPGRILECRALLETYHDLRRERTAWAQRIHAVLFHQGAPALGEGMLRSEQGLAALRAAPAAHLSPGGPARLAPAGTPSRRRGPGGRSSGRAPPVLRWAVSEAGRTHARSSAPDYRYYAQVKARCGGKRAALSEARKILRQACHILAELGDDALAPAA